MKNLKFLILAVSLIFMLSILETVSHSEKEKKNPHEQHCNPCAKNGYKCRAGCDDDSTDTKCKKKYSEEACTPIVDQLCPLEANVTLCSLPLCHNNQLLQGILKNISIHELCLDICFDPIKCPGENTNIYVYYCKETCTLYIKATNLDTLLNCILLTICRICENVLGIKLKGDDKGKGLLF